MATSPPCRKGFLRHGASVLQGTSAIGWIGHTVPLGLDHRNPYRTGLDSDEQEHESFGTVQNACLEEGVHGTYSKEESGRHKQKRKYSQLVGIRVRHRLDCLYRSGAKPDYVNLKDPATPASIG
jgi:hypothetical protein